MLFKLKSISLLILCYFIFVPLQFLKAKNDGSRYAKTSILAEGKWVQLKVTENSIYKLTYDDIKKMGFSDPAKIKIYGYGGWILDEDFRQKYVDDLPEVAVYLSKGNDGVFGSGDYLLFYGRGTRKWSYNSSKDIYEHENNPYSTYASYFITESSSGPKEMTTKDAMSTADLTLSVFDDYAVYERDLTHVLASGRELFGESFVGNTSQSFNFKVPGITSDEGKVSLSFVGSPKNAAVPAILSIDDKEVLRVEISKLSGDSYHKATMDQGWAVWSAEKSENVKATVSYNSANQGYAMLNFISLNMKRQLKSYNEAFTFFRNKENIRNNAKFVIENANSSSMVWDITENFDSYLVQSSISGNQLSFQSDAEAKLKEFVLVDPGKTFPTPQVVGEIANQDLHGLPQTDMVIIVPEVYKHLAETLAEKHRTHSGLTVTVVQDNWIFNEFSSGTRDATAFRRFMKMFYDRAETEDEKPKYLLLYGDGIFDNRHLTAEGSKLDPANFLISYQVKESANENSSYGTDDYFGFLDDDEGTYLSTAKLDLGIGRFPVRSLSQAEAALNKVLNYIDNTQYGNWKNKLIFAADNTDVDTGSRFCLHGVDANKLGNYVEKNHPEYTVTRYFMDAYKSTIVNGKTTYPDMKKAFLSSLSDGCFLFSYTGHGSTSALSAEDLLHISDVRRMKFDNLPLWITATCDFGWYDAFTTSAGEEVFLNNNGGGIALFTTTRVVNSYDNDNLSQEFIRHLFAKKEGKYLRLGDIIRESKVAIGTNANKLNFVLLGDPALRLNYPEYNVKLEKVNGVSIAEQDDISFRALDRVTLEGIITDESGNKIENFQGNLRSTIFDSQQTIKSVVRDKETDATFDFKSYPNMIYLGNNEVKDGSFNLTFNVPLDISYERNNGKMSFYAHDSETGFDANGSFLEYYLAGSNEKPSGNEKGPEILEIFLNTPNFQNGDKVNETPYFYASVSDEDGINMAGGLGHDIQICIDNNPYWTHTLNGYYSPVSATEGTIGFSIPTLPEGEHKLVFRVWDILNNPTTDSLTFYVEAGYRPEIFDLTASINPAKQNTYFLLTHDLPETELNVEIRVYDLTGRSIWTYSEQGSSGFLKDYPIEWNLQNTSGSRIQPGIYIYRAAVATGASKAATKAKKIIVVGQ